MTRHYRIRLEPVRQPRPVYIHIADAARELGFDGEDQAFRAWFKPQGIQLDHGVFLDLRYMAVLRARVECLRRGEA